MKRKDQVQGENKVHGWLRGHHLCPFCDCFEDVFVINDDHHGHDHGHGDGDGDRFPLSSRSLKRFRLHLRRCCKEEGDQNHRESRE